MATSVSIAFASAILVAYPYLLYPAFLWVLGLAVRLKSAPGQPQQWPTVTLTIPVYNDRVGIRGMIERTLKLDYPRDRIQILVISDASTDGTDDVVKEFASQGVELLRLPRRGGKTAAENGAVPHVRGEIVVNCDASIRVPPHALKNLVRRFGDPTVGVASCRDISVTHADDDINTGESGYVNYEMWIRRLETRVYGIIGASGCFYATRKHLHERSIPDELSRDFAAPLVAREHGFRSVSADDAICFVPRTGSLGREYRRKVRTMTRGLETLFYKRHLLNPFKYGWFAWMLFSHKLARWLVPWALLVCALAIAWPPVTSVWTRGFLVLCALGVILGTIGWTFQRAAETLPPLRIPAYVVAGIAASLHAWVNALRGDRNSIWEPTRRDPATS